MVKSLSILLVALGAGVGCAASRSPGSELPVVVIQRGHAEAIDAVSIGPEGRLVATASRDRTVKIWDAWQGREVRTLASFAEAPGAIALDRDGRMAAIGERGGRVGLWSLEDGVEVRALARHQGAASALAFAPGGDRVASGGESGEVLVTEVRTGRTALIFEGHTRAVVALAFDREGQILVTASQDGRARVWDLARGESRGELDVGAPLVDMALSPEGGAAALVTQGGAVILWSIDGGAGSRREIAAQGATCAAWVSADRLAIGDRLGGVGFTDGAGGPIVKGSRVEAHKGAVLRLAVAPGSGVMVSVGEDGEARLWDPGLGQVVRTLRGRSKPVGMMAIDPQERSVATALGSVVRLWDLATAQLIWSREVGQGGLAFSADGSMLVRADRVCEGAGACRGRLLWIDSATGRVARSVEVPSGSVIAPTFSRDGGALAAGLEGGGIGIWDLGSGAMRAGPRGHLREIAALSFSPDGGRLLSAGRDKAVKLWALADPGKGRARDQEVLELKGHTGQVHCAAFDPRGEIVATGGQDGEVRLWDLSDGGGNKVLSGHEAAVEALAFSPDGALLVSASADGTLRVWEGATGRLVRVLRGHEGPVRGVGFLRGGAEIVSGSEDGTVRIWDAAGWVEKVAMLAIDEEDYVALTPDNHYRASRQGLRGIALRQGARVFGFEQFDLRLNRPDVILERLGRPAGLALVPLYETTWRRRLKKMAVTEAMLSEDFHLPEVRLLSRDLPLSTRQRALSFSVRATDSQHPVTRLQVYINGVPIHGAAGLDLGQGAAQEVSSEVSVELSRGYNQVEVSALNVQGVESIRESFAVVLEAPEVPAALYVAVVGVSDYRDDRYDLRYAAKDAQDVARWFKAQGQGEVHVVQVLDAQATREAIEGLRAFFERSGVDDRVVLFLAGHGLLAPSMEYYFGTTDIDFEAPEGRGVIYEDIEGLLDGIPARRKLLLMDTCHSGEVEVVESQDRPAAQVPEGRVSGRGGRYLGQKKSPGLAPQEGRAVGLDLLGELFADVRRGSGATVLASANGFEFALESPRWQNGVFTFALLEGLRTGGADADGDGQVRLFELRRYVIQRVRELTDDQQNPTARRENLSLDFVIATPGP